MADKGELLNEAEVEFLLAAAGEGEPTSSAPAPTSGEGQTVTMRGDLEQINLADIFQTLAMAKMEGVLRVRNPSKSARSTATTATCASRCRRAWRPGGSANVWFRQDC